MKTGPKTRPTALKILEGNPGKRALPTNEPKPVSVIPVCSSFIKGAARREWNRIAPELYLLGLLSTIDRAALEAYCMAYGRWENAERQLNEIAKLSTGRMQYLYRTTNGNLVMNPILSVANKAMEQMHKFLVEFGMTPSSRTHIITTKGDSQDPMDELLSGSRAN